MRNLLVILILAGGPLAAIPQTSFIIDDIAGPEISAFSDVQYFDGKYYFLSLHTEYFSPWRNFGELNIFNGTGQLLNSFLLGGYGYQYFKILNIQPDQIQMLGSLETDSCHSNLILSNFHFTTGLLEHTAQQALCHEDKVIKRLTVTKGFDDEIFFEGGYGGRITNNVDHRTFLATLDSTGQFKVVFDPTDFSQAHFSIDFSEKGYVLKETHLCDFYDKAFKWRKRRTNFTQRYDPSHFAYNHPFGNKYLMDQAELAYDEGAGQAIRLVDSNLTVRKEIVIALYPNNPRRVSFPMMGGIDVVNDSVAWIVSNYVGFPIGYPYFSLIKVDDELNILCQQFIGFDAIYEIYGVSALENNGVVLYGWRKPTEEIFFSELQDVYAIKVGENCELVTSSEILRSSIYAISVFPNPTINSLTFNVNGFDPATLKVEIYNITGSILFSKQDLSNEIEITDFPSGNYFYRILQKEKLLGMGSWVKQ